MDNILEKIKYGDELIMCDKEGQSLLEVDYNGKLPSWANPFRLWFNANFESFRTYGALSRKVSTLINQYNLNEIE